MEVKNLKKALKEIEVAIPYSLGQLFSQIFVKFNSSQGDKGRNPLFIRSIILTPIGN